MSDLVSQGRGRVLDELYVPVAPKPADFAKAIRAIGRAKPDVIFSTVVGEGTAMFYEAYHKAGFDAAQMPIASLTTSEAEVAEMAPEVARGHITAAPFFDILDTPAARAFVAAYRPRRSGEPAPTSMAWSMKPWRMPNTMRRRAGCVSTATITTPISGRGWPGWMKTAASRSSGIPASGSSRTRTA
jgi:branched-chain amino acid transport system substrate-binding protein